MTAPRKPERTFDTAKLMAMQEPLIIRVEKIRGNQKQPIEIPPHDQGDAPGSGYPREDIMKLESWLVNEYVGGGNYAITVTDNVGGVMAWDIVYPLNQFPERVPNPQAAYAPIGAAAPMAVPQAAPMQFQAPAQQAYQPAPAPQAYAPFSGNGNGFASQTWQAPRTYPQPAPQQQVQQVQPPPYVPSPFAPFGAGFGAGFGNGGFGMPYSPFGRMPFMGGGWGDDDKKSSGSDERVEALKAQLQQQQQLQMQRDAEEQRRRDDERHQREMDAVKAEMAAIERARREEASERDRREAERTKENVFQASIAAIAQQVADLAKMQAAPQTSSEVELLKREIADQKARSEREADQRRWEMAQAEHRREMEKLQLQIAQSNNSRPDPMVEMMRDQVRASADQTKELARVMQEDRARAATLPFEMAKLLKDASSAPDTMINTLSRSFGGILETYDRVIQSVAQIQGQGQPSVGMAMLQEGIEKASALAKQYINSQTASKIETARSQAVVANAQAQVVTAQLAGPQMQQPAPQPPQQVQQQQQVQQPIQQAVSQPRQSDPNMGIASHPQRASSQGIQDSGAPTTVEAQHKKQNREIELFGLAHPTIMGVRKDVLGGKVSPPELVTFLLQQVNQAMQLKQAGHEVVVPPVFQVFLDSNFGDFVEAVLGNEVPAVFRDACTQLLFQIYPKGLNGPQNPTALANASAAEDEDDEDEDEEDDGQAETQLT